MKKLILVALAIFSITTYAQVQGCVWTATLADTGEVDYYQCRSALDFWYITVDLPDSQDVIKVYTGTNLPDSTYEDEIYTLTSVIDLDSNKVMDWITGDELQHTYKIGGEKRRNIKLEATTWEDTITYYIETY